VISYGVAGWRREERERVEGFCKIGLVWYHLVSPLCSTTLYIPLTMNYGDRSVLFVATWL
jgi:hypothetical protein